MKELVPGVFTWDWFSAPHGYDFHGTLLELPGGNVCIDPVEPTAEDLDDLIRRGVSQILLTNRNHLRAANRVRAATGAATRIHRGDTDHARAQGAELDGELAAGDEIGPLVMIAAPGKSPGELAVHWPERRLLVVGDAVIGNPPGRLGLLPDAKMDDPARLRASVRRLAELDLETLVLGDGMPILSNASAELARLVASFVDP